MLSQLDCDHLSAYLDSIQASDNPRGVLRTLLYPPLVTLCSIRLPCQQRQSLLLGEARQKPLPPPLRCTTIEGDPTSTRWLPHFIFRTYR